MKAKPTSSSSIQVTWKPPAKDVTYGPIKGYYVGYKVKNDAKVSSYTFKTLEVTDIRNQNEECLITGLKKATKYSIIIQAFNSKGSSPASEEIIVQTAEKGI